jgi:hypothetical protein
MRKVSKLAVVVGTVALGAGVVSGCGPTVQPVFSKDIGVTAIPAPQGSLAGTFALKTINTQLVHVPILGDKEGGGSNYRLVHRTYDDATDTYLQSSVLCGGENIEVAGVLSGTPVSTYREVPESKNEVVKVDADGVYTSTGHIQLWALQDLTDPYTDVLPTTKDDANKPAFQPHVFDMDHDGKPGFTVQITGAVTGELYAVQRKTVDLSGITLGPDHAEGLSINKNQLIQLGNNNILLDRQGEGSSEPDPDPKQSYFEEARIADGSTCDDVMQAESKKILHDIRPF